MIRRQYHPANNYGYVEHKPQRRKRLKGKAMSDKVEIVKVESAEGSALSLRDGTPLRVTPNMYEHGQCNFVKVPAISADTSFEPKTKGVPDDESQNTMPGEVVPKRVRKGR